MGAQHTVCCVHSVQDTKGIAHPSGNAEPCEAQKRCCGVCRARSTPSYQIKYDREQNGAFDKQADTTQQAEYKPGCDMLLLYRPRSIVCQQQAGAEPQLQSSTAARDWPNPCRASE